MRISDWSSDVCSSDLVAGALYAAGYSGFDLQEMAFALDRATIADWSMFGKGLIRGEALQDFVNQAVKNRPIEGLNIPFACVATSVGTGQAVLFQRGNVGQAVRASSSVPGRSAERRAWKELVSPCNY